MSEPLRKPAPAKPALVSSAPQSRRLKKGELLFAEGENSRAMYLLKSGMIRLYKAKGDAQIELDTVHSGQVLGELAFLDGNPRSASGEALIDCELMEISGPTFQSVLTQAPEWLKILLKTVVGRLRAASTRIRQLETASTSFDYSDKESGTRSARYIYLSPSDVLKIAAGALLVSSKYGDGLDIRVGLLQRYSNQIMGVPVAKITTFLDILKQANVLVIDDATAKVTLTDPEFLEELITYLNGENLLEPSKRHDISMRGFFVMSLIAKNLVSYPTDEATGLTKVNVAEIRKLETTTAGKEPFRMEEFEELVKLGYASALNLKSGDEATTTVNAATFRQATRFQRVVKLVDAANEQKRKGGK